MAAEGPVGGVEQLHRAVGVAADDLDLAVWQDAQRRAPAGDLQGADRGKALARGVEGLRGARAGVPLVARPPAMRAWPRWRRAGPGGRRANPTRPDGRAK